MVSAFALLQRLWSPAIGRPRQLQGAQPGGSGEGLSTTSTTCAAATLALRVRPTPLVPRPLSATVGTVEDGDDETLSNIRQGATGTPALVHEYYKAFGDLERTQPVVPPERGERPSLFVTDELKTMRMFALSAGGSGLSAKARAEFYHTTVLAERAAMRTQHAAAAAVRAVVEGETPYDDSSDDDSDAIDPPDVATGVNQYSCPLLMERPTAACTSRNGARRRSSRAAPLTSFTVVTS